MIPQVVCCVCEKLEAGRVRTTYITFYVEEEAVTYRLRACKTCTGDARHLWMEYGDQKLEDGTWRLGNSNVSEIMELQKLTAMSEPTAVHNANGRRRTSSLRADSESSSAQSTA